MLQGVVIKCYNSYYYVLTKNHITMCTIRGRFKKERFSLLVGDEVEYTSVSKDKGVIETILPRRSLLDRPMVANVDQVLLVFAAANPDINKLLVDRFLILAESSKLNIILCINKIDLVDIDTISPIIDLYRSIGYQTILLSSVLNWGFAELRSILHNKVSVLAGPSGVGKSTLLNSIDPNLKLTTGELSHKIGRGKHTTRYAELMPVSSGGFVVDTPGFSFTDFTHLDEKILARCFPEFVELADQCKFSTCLHYKEPQCAIKEAVANDTIHKSRYQSYIETLEEIISNKRGIKT